MEYLGAYRLALPNFGLQVHAPRSSSAQRNPFHQGNCVDTAVLSKVACDLLVLESIVPFWTQASLPPATPYFLKLSP